MSTKTCYHCEPNEKLISIKEAAEQLGIPYWKLLRAANARQITTYSVLNDRHSVFVSELLSEMRNDKENRDEY